MIKAHTWETMTKYLFVLLDSEPSCSVSLNSCQQELKNTYVNIYIAATISTYYSQYMFVQSTWESMKYSISTDIKISYIICQNAYILTTKYTTYKCI